MIQLVEVVKNTRSYELREVFVNPRHVVMLREDHATRSAINEGKVIEGMDIVNKIKGVPTGKYGFHADVPTTPVVITHAKVIEK